MHIVHVKRESFWAMGLSRNLSWELVNILCMSDWLDEYEKEIGNRKGEWKCFLNHWGARGRELFSAIFSSSLRSAGFLAQEDLVYFLKGLAYKADLFLALASSNKN